MSDPNDLTAGVRRIAEHLIRAAMERGEFDHLEGAGKPLPDIDEPYDPMWWVRKKLAAERVKLKREEAEALLRLGARAGRARPRHVFTAVSHSSR